MPDKLNVAFVWHQHQPYYRLPKSDVLTQPWVRLHGLKDYLDMALMVREFPKIHQTINLVPCLIEQLEDYASGEVTDRWLQLCRRPAEELTAEEKREILQNLFSANIQTMIAPFPRYYALHRRVSSRTLSEACNRLTINDLRDIQVWFNLVWLDPLFRERDEIPLALVTKGEDFTEEEKHRLLDYQQGLLKRVVSTHRELQDEGLIEVSTTPYFHPILPLLCDFKIARESEPHAVLPQEEFRHPEDAEVQIRWAVEQYERYFGRPPRGMWPSEGSVSGQVVGLIAKHGLSWIATDEEILALSVKSGSLRDGSGRLVNPGPLYQPYLLDESSGCLSVIFRDHALSDLIGFQYSRMAPRVAAGDLIGKLLAIKDLGLPEDALVSIILDGENCWEFYPNDGHDFLSTLYERISESESLQCVTVSEHLERYPARGHIKRIFPGSWIHHDFRIWIGGTEDNSAWTALSEARNLLASATERNSPQIEDPAVREMVWKHLYAAEGSDWFWWYSEEHSTANDPLFDSLFREHLMAIYDLLGEDIPSSLYEPIGLSLSRFRDEEQVVHTIRPILDGKVSHYLEWLAAGRYRPSEDGAAMHRASVLIEAVFFGIDLVNLYVRVDSKASFAFFVAEGYQLQILEIAPREAAILLSLTERGFELQYLPESVERPTFRWNDAAVGQVAEMAIPWSVLGCPPGGECRFRLRVLRDGREVESYPVGRSLSVPCPDERFDSLAWVV